MAQNDSELRELLERYAETIETDDGEYLAVDIDHVVEPIMQLITADRKRVALEAAIMGAKFGNAAIRQHNIANPTKPMNLDAVRDSGIQQAKAWAEQQC